MVHFYQPRSRVALQVPLKDPWVVNAALLGAKGDFQAWQGAALAPKLGTDSMLIADQVLASVTDTVKWELGYGGKGGAGFATFDASRYDHPLPQPQRQLIYRSLSLARANYDLVDDDIVAKLANLNIHNMPASTINNHFSSLLPKLNSHQRYVQFSILFNSLPTDRRLAPVRRGVLARAAAQAAPPAQPPAIRSRKPRRTVSPNLAYPPPPLRSPHPGCTRSSARVRLAHAHACDRARVARDSAEHAAVLLAEELRGGDARRGGPGC